jgi:glycosyltransferase involved in cell wall biosynthesis
MAKSSPPSPAAELAAGAEPWAGKRVVLVHDWLTGMRGGEKVLAALCRIFPTADLLTLVHQRGSVSAPIEARRVRTSVIQRLPAPMRWYRHYLPLFPAAIELFNLDDADLVISTSHCAAKSVVRPGRAVHICYCHSPMRYAWDQFEAYFGTERVGRAANAALRPVLAGLARWDRDTAHRVDRFVANSRFVAGRIGRYYNRPALVLHPPVDTKFFTPGSGEPGSYFLVVSALVPYKRLEIAIDAAQRLGVPLRIVGTGPDLARLQARAGSTVTFLGALDDDALREQYRGARAVILPGVEDFGIVPVEAMACGRPVVALDAGGATETVVPGVTGLLVREPDATDFAAALDRTGRADFDPAAIRRHAETFNADRFDAGFRRLVADTLAEAPC